VTGATQTVNATSPDRGAKAPDSPFGASRGRTGRRFVRPVLFGLLLVAAVVGAYLATRNPAAAGKSSGHAHGALPAADSTIPVRLSERSERRIGVTFAEATLGPLSRSVRTVGLVAYDETRVATVAPLVDGWVSRLSVNFTGQAVRNGDPLMSLYSPMVIATAQELVLAKQLSKDVAAGTPEAVQGAQGLVESARRRLLYWNVPVEEVERIERTGEVRKTVTFRSPVSGVVVEKAVLPGQQLMAGQPAYKIADLSTIWLEGEVFEKDLPAVRLGQLVTAEFQALPGDRRTGRITYVYPTLNPETRTARVRVALANPGLLLKPGMYATIRFDAATPPVISVPRSAVLSTGKRDLVFVRRPDGALVPRDVVLGIATDDRLQVLTGLSVGETVVASATFLVDAESNLGSTIGGMASMPGMDASAPANAPSDTAAKQAEPGTAQPAPRGKE